MENCSDTSYDSCISAQALLPAACGSLLFSMPGTAHPFLSPITEGMYNDTTFIIYPTVGVHFLPHLGHVQQERNLIPYSFVMFSSTVIEVILSIAFLFFFNLVFSLLIQYS